MLSCSSSISLAASVSSACASSFSLKATALSCCCRSRSSRRPATVRWRSWLAAFRSFCFANSFRHSCIAVKVLCFHSWISCSDVQLRRIRTLQVYAEHRFSQWRSYLVLLFWLEVDACSELQGSKLPIATIPRLNKHTTVTNVKVRNATCPDGRFFEHV